MTGLGQMLDENELLRQRIEQQKMAELIARNARLEYVMKTIKNDLVLLSVYHCDCRSEDEINPEETANKCLDLIKQVLKM